jgi:hypothetical protein
MVHALHEIWRVLAGNGTLVDLRPLSCQCPIELVTPSGAVHVGEADATGMAADDDASDRAIRDIVEQGRFMPRGDTQFDFDLYWDSVRELRSFIEASPRMKHVRPPYTEMEAVYREVSAGRREGARVRCRRRTMLKAYQKAMVWAH